MLKELKQKQRQIYNLKDNVEGKSEETLKLGEEVIKLISKVAKLISKLKTELTLD